MKKQFEPLNNQALNKVKGGLGAAYPPTLPTLPAVPAQTAGNASLPALPTLPTLPA